MIGSGTVKSTNAKLQPSFKLCIILARLLNRVVLLWT